MNPGKHDLLISVPGQCFHFPTHTFHGTAPYSSSGIGNDAVGAELVTSVLHLDIGPGMLCCPRKMQILILPGMADIHQIFSDPFPAFFICFQDMDDLFFPVIANHNVHAVRYFLRLFLHITAAGRHDGVRVHLPGAVQHLAGFPIRHVRHRTGIDNIYICLFMKRHDLIAAVLQQFLHGLRLICVHLAAQVVQCSFFPHIYVLFSKMFLDFSFLSS